MPGVTDPLAALIEYGLIVPESGAPEIGYQFRHALVQEAAYRSILHQDRARLHGIIADALQRLYPERTTELAAVLAGHLDRAGQPARARRCYIEAGDFAYQAYANTEAAAHYGRALDLTDDADPLPIEVRRHVALRLGRALELTGDFKDALNAYEALEAWGREHAQQDLVLAVLVHQAQVRCTANDLYDAEKGEVICT